ncbi:lipid-A-disaccharide synthase [Pseudopelagicola sp. nBUS_19]|uniref:lipid-A-disaccharide synthase n=1 Tax=Pseudopelagicola sp. nBUS_19 TaxID=3395316 RepID=UPI003EC028F7
MLVFLIAGEASGDKLGAALMQGLKELCPEVQFIGVGGSLMQAEGLDSLFPMAELSVMGIAEILPKYRHLLKRMRGTVKSVLDSDCDVLVTIDSPDFCLRVAKKVKSKRNIRTVHYVAPSVWAWRPNRVQKMIGVIDQVLALLPFEPPYMEAAGLRCDFVGHPVTSDPLASDQQVAEFREQHDFQDAPIMLVLPGSRHSEVSRLTPVFGEVVALINQVRPDIRFVLPAVATVAGLVRDLTAHWQVAPLVLDSRNKNTAIVEVEKRAAFRAADVALAASGTVSLELAASHTPLVVAYDMNWFSWQIISRMALIDTVTLVNLVTDTRTVPEFLGPNFRSDAIAPALLDVLAAPQRQFEAMNRTMNLLGGRDAQPGRRAAIAILNGLETNG